MALQRQVEVAKDGEVVVGKVVDTYVDEETGIVAQKETVAIEVPNHLGGTNIVIAERLRAVKVPNWIQQNRSIPSAPTPRQIEQNTYSSIPDSESSSGCGIILDLLCFPCFLPCLANYACLFCWICFVVAGFAVFVALTVVFPLKCEPLYNQSVVILVLLSVMGFIMLNCFCFTCCSKKDTMNRTFQSTMYCCAGLCGLTFIAFVVAGSVMVFTYQHSSTDNCADQSFPVVVAAMSFSYALILLFFCVWSCCCFQFWKAIQNQDY